MFKYILKRILLFIPTILAISLVTFLISQNAPGDPVESMLNKQSGESQMADKLASEKQYLQLKSKLGLDLPVFYMSMSTMASCDTLYKVVRMDEKAKLDKMTSLYGNWAAISHFNDETRKVYKEITVIPSDSLNSEKLIEIRAQSNELIKQYKIESIQRSIDTIKTLCGDIPSLQSYKTMVSGLSAPLAEIEKNKTTWKNYIPTLHWYGSNNQYHHWITNFFKGDFGISYQDQRPIGTKIWDAMKWTMLLNLISIILTYIISIPMGVYSAKNKGTTVDRISTASLFMLYSLPNFWIGTMLVVYLCNPDFLNWFPPYGTGEAGNYKDIAWHLILPILCITYPSFAFISRQMRGGMLTVLGQDYIRTAKAKGLSDKVVTWKHALRNSLLPIITMFASVFPLALSGSIAIELIFSLPGMGQLSVNAINARDYPMVYTVMMFTSILTLIGFLVSDVLYSLTDPRITFTKK